MFAESALDCTWHIRDFLFWAQLVGSKVKRPNFNSLLQDYFPMYKYTCTLLLSHNLCCVVFWLDYTRQRKGGIVV